ESPPADGEDDAGAGQQLARPWHRPAHHSKDVGRNEILGHARRQPRPAARRLQAQREHDGRGDREEVRPGMRVHEGARRTAGRRPPDVGKPARGPGYWRRDTHAGDIWTTTAVIER